MRRQTVLGLGEELTDRTQQRIVSIAARDYGRLCNGRSTPCVFEENAGDARCGYCPLFYGYLPAMRHDQGELGHDDEQAKQRLYAA